MTLELCSIARLKQIPLDSRLDARVHAQIEAIAQKATREGKPFYEVALADAEGKLVLRAWSDGPAFAICEGLKAGGFIEVNGEFSVSSAYGLDSKRWTCRELEIGERDALLAGPAELQARQTADFEFIRQTAATIRDPRLAALCQNFLSEYGERFRRTAAARGYHHARRGGLVEHVAQMTRSAVGIAAAYQYLNRDLLLTGVLFHDCGKLWENSMPVDGFVMPYDERGELLGHITIGIELVNTLWRKLLGMPAAADWSKLQPASEDVRLHLLHLIASHHGELEFGSPVVPKTPEGWALHYVDNLDAKMEMMAGGYATSRQIAARIQERVRPLAGNLVAPLAPFNG